MYRLFKNWREYLVESTQQELFVKDNIITLYDPEKGPDAKRSFSQERDERWDKERHKHAIRICDVDPEDLSLEQWAEKNGF